MTNESNLQKDELEKVLNKISEIVEHSNNGNYIYRGESQDYEKVASGLYRAYTELGITEPRVIEVVIQRAQEASSELAQGYLSDIDKETVLPQIQHYSGKTNLIDFTTDYLIALFFACTGNNEEDGRIILLKNEDPDKEKDGYKTREMPPVIGRAVSQKSIFVESSTGFIELTECNSITIEIPKDLKEPLLDYLEKHHDISAKRVYNDLHGFIRLQDIYLPIYPLLRKASDWEEKGDSAAKESEKQKFYDEAIKIYTEILKYKPIPSEVYDMRGQVYARKESFDRAIEDYTEAIKLNNNIATFYHHRSKAYDHIGKLQDAIKDYERAMQLDPKEASVYYDLCVLLIKERKLEKVDELMDKLRNMNVEEINFFLPILETAYCSECCKIHLEAHEWEEAKEQLSKLISMKSSLSEDIVASLLKNIETFAEEQGDYVRNQYISMFERVSS